MEETMMNTFKKLSVMASLAAMLLATSIAAQSATSSYSKPAYKSSYTKPIDPCAGPSSPCKVKPSAGMGYSKPQSEPAPSVATPSSGYSKPPSTASVTPGTAPSAPVPATVMGTAASKSMSNDSLAKYQAERASAKAPPQQVDGASLRSDPSFAATRRQYSSVDDYMSQRTTHITVYRNSHPDVFIYTRYMYPNYGMYDSSFLMGLMLGYLGSSSTNNAAWLYSHQNDPWYPQWRADMQAQAESNAELKSKMAAMDAEIANLKAQNAKIATVALPEGVAGDVAIAPEAVIAAESLSLIHI